MSEPLKISVHVEEKRYQPTQEKTVVPDWDPVEVTPDKGYALSKVTVEGMPEPTESETFTANGTYNVGRIGTAIVDVGIDLQNKTITPTEQTQTVESDAGYDGLGAVTVKPIPPEYVVPTGSVEITANGQGIDVAGKATANVNVPQGVFPSGTKVITENVTGEDVTNYAAVDVAVPGPSGTKQISITANGTTTEDVMNYADAEITVNTLPAKGLVFEDYDSEGYPHSARFVGSWTEIPDEFCNSVFEANRHNYSGYYDTVNKNIESIIIPEGVTKIGYRSFRACTALKHISFPSTLSSLDAAFNSCVDLVEIVLPRLVTTIVWGTFNNCYYLERAIFLGDMVEIGQDAFGGSTLCELYDFSHNTVVPLLYSVNSLKHKSGCVIRIPAALSDTTLGEGNGWESETNWSALTDIVWEVV